MPEPEWAAQFRFSVAGWAQGIAHRAALEVLSDAPELSRERVGHLVNEIAKEALRFAEGRHPE